MAKIRVLIVDDAVVVRRIVSQALSADPMFEVAGTASNGRIALAKLNQLNPDVITLDVEMPVMDGLQTLAELRKRRPHLPVIMFSTLTQRGAAATVEALSLGASDYVPKPSNSGGLTESLQRVRDELIPKIKMFCGVETIVAPEVKAVPPPPGLWIPEYPVRVVAIGVSTGGPQALAQILPKLPADFPAPIVIVQHMPAVFTEMLANRLEGTCQLTVREGKGGHVIKPGEVWIAPGGYHMVVKGQPDHARLDINEDPPENSCRPAADVLFRSVARVFGKNALAVVLTGMGQDGLRGCEMIREAGAGVLIQDKQSSVVWGMPGAVANAGLANKIAPVDEMARELVKLVRSAE